MYSFHRKLLVSSYKIFDMAIMLGWFVVATAVVAHQIESINFYEFIDMRIKARNLAIFIGFMLAWRMIFGALKLYETKRLGSRKQEALDVVKATSLGIGLVAAFGTIFRIIMVTPLFLAVFWAGTTVTTIAARIMLRLALVSLRKRGRNLRHLVIVGINRRSLEFARKVSSKPELGYMLDGFVDRKDQANMREFAKAGYPYISDFQEFPGFLRNHVVDEIAMFLPVKSHYHEASAIIDLCEKHGIIMRMSADLFHLKIARSGVDQVDGVQLLTISTGTIEGFQVFVKRSFDVAASAALLALFSPFFLLVPLLIAISSPGPVFFVQNRVGLNKRRFRLYKFRTMIADAEGRIAELEALNEAGGPVFKIKDDPRITPVGKLLRKTSIDELPQIFNVLKGDMSLVGPRPLPVRDY